MFASAKLYCYSLNRDVGVVALCHVCSIVAFLKDFLERMNERVYSTLEISSERTNEIIRSTVFSNNLKANKPNFCFFEYSNSQAICSNYSCA